MVFYSDLNYIKPKKGELLEDVDSIIQSVYTILGTKPNQRVFRPGWGGSLIRYLHEPCDELTASSMMYDIVQALKTDPRVILDMGQSSIIPDPVQRLFYIQLKLDIPGFSDYEKTISLTFKQKDQRI